ncbi:ATP-dependent zinc protease [Flavimarina sp. Hel_I_48]|uniref:ATP-dependent zinc protease family protein n=1 Tax=Flavimarina sp. Hel_I_48 TaxID=1392488 RepID=UPI0004DF00FD|nr:RimK/LysX family protein [Flavimarina sp. Hel_I_48]
MDKILIGRTDKVDFPTLGFSEVDVKIDTGAYTSSIHCTHIREEENRLCCTFLDPQHPDYDGKEMIFTAYDMTAVKSSNGEVQTRYVVQANIRIFKKLFKISLTLSSREDMRFPVLLGRKFLTKKFIVDTALTDLSFNNKIHEYKDPIQE